MLSKTNKCGYFKRRKSKLNLPLDKGHFITEKATIEHFIPKYRGGADDERNLLPLCKNCNKQKGSRVVAAEEYSPFLKSTFCENANEYKMEWERASNG